jgi:hypothetical protein
VPSVRSRFVCEAAIEVPGEAKIRQRGRLVNDRLGLACENGLAHRGRVEQIERDRLRAERPHALGVSRRPERADHLVASVHKLGDEPGADRTARPYNEDSHRVLLLARHIPPDTRGSTAMTRRDERM